MHAADRTTAAEEVERIEAALHVLTEALAHHGRLNPATEGRRSWIPG